MMWLDSPAEKQKFNLDFEEEDAEFDDFDEFFPAQVKNWAKF